MKYCPNCGHELEEGVTRCWKGCGIGFAGPNRFDDPIGAKSEKLRELELEYKLAFRGLTKGIPATLAAMASGLMSLLATAVVLVTTSKTLLTGTQLVFIFGILAAAIILYFALVFGRAARIRARIEKEKKELEVGIGNKVR